MELSKIKTLIDFVGRSNVTELTVTEEGTTVRIFRKHAPAAPVVKPGSVEPQDVQSVVESTKAAVSAPIFGLLHTAPAPGEPAFVALGDVVEEGQTLFIIEAMKVFNRISAPCAGRIAKLTSANGNEVDAGDLLAEIA
ncbi:acetyl-CoA carboxylase biotin carboxyl carrier protein subunit [Rhizobium sp. 18055]|uniref:acetyl-CoA carboxylase biotin carboxyl carrier protein n=1 Tax=Rhizobium sp. 18055 TaxID=2681403 RepID=UPI0013597B44|nr:acetyl-CoA carboxylase biotin carboxyl carrier protein subunit [Rhizobium sp. 18055]